MISGPEWERSFKSARAGTRWPFAREMIFRRYRSSMSSFLSLFFTMFFFYIYFFKCAQRIASAGNYSGNMINLHVTISKTLLSFSLLWYNTIYDLSEILWYIFVWNNHYTAAFMGSNIFKNYFWESFFNIIWK